MKLLGGSPREKWLVTIVTAALALMVPWILYQAMRTEDFDPIPYLTSASVLGGALVMFLAYVTILTARETSADAVLQAGLTRAAVAAPVVSTRVLTPPTMLEAGDDVRIDLVVEVANHGTTPAVVTPEKPSTGRLRDLAPFALASRPDGPAGSTTHVRCLPLTVRIPRGQIGLVAGDVGADWPIVVPVTVQDVARTVTDVYHLSFRLRPHAARSGGWTWTVEGDPGYAARVSRTPAEIETRHVPVPRPPTRVEPAGSASASPARPPSPRAPQRAGARRP